MTGAGAISFKIVKLEPEPEIWVLFLSPSLWGKRVVEKKQWFLIFNGPNHSGAGFKTFYMLVGARAKELDAWSWSRSSHLFA